MDQCKDDVDDRQLIFTGIIGGCLALLVAISLGVAWRARRSQDLTSGAEEKVKLAKVNLPPGMGLTQPGTLEAGENTHFGEDQVVRMVLERQQQAAVDNPIFMKRRNTILLSLLVAYVVVCLGVPTLFYGTLSCEDGLPWELHLLFLVLFVATKSCELWIYRNDPSLADPLPLLIDQRFNVLRYLNTFEFKFGLSFMAYFDAYQDAVATATAYKCGHVVSQILAPWMMMCYLLGVVGLQWGVATFASFRDPTKACFLKLLHMDSVAIRMTIPPNQKKTWTFLHLARTMGEDVPQAILQTFFVIFVKENPFMVISICCAVGSSALAVKDAAMRKLVASAGVEKQLLVQATDKEVHSVQCYAIDSAVVELTFIRRSGRQHCEWGRGRMRPNQLYMLQPHEHVVQVNVAHHEGQLGKDYLRGVELITDKGRRKVFGAADTFDLQCTVSEGQQVVGLVCTVHKNGMKRITGVKKAPAVADPGASATTGTQGEVASPGESAVL